MVQCFLQRKRDGYKFILHVLTFDTGLMGDEHPCDVLADGDGRLGHLLDRRPQSSLSGAVVDKVLHPGLVKADDGAPKEPFISSAAAVPLIR